MKCPSCKNKNFTPSKKFPKPLMPRGKEKFDTVDYRYYICVECGHRFVTKEVWEKDVEVLKFHVKP